MMILAEIVEYTNGEVAFNVRPILDELLKALIPVIGVGAIILIIQIGVKWLFGALTGNFESDGAAPHEIMGSPERDEWLRNERQRVRDKIERESIEREIRGSYETLRIQKEIMEEVRREDEDYALAEFEENYEPDYDDE